MSKLEVTKRQHLIINKMRRAKQATFEEIVDYLQRESDLHGYDFTVSKRTFSRDLEDIDTMYGIAIKFDFSSKYYYIEDEFEPEINGRILEAFDMYHALKIQERQQPYLHLEKRHPQGTENLFDLLHTIKNHLQVTFSYQKYYKDHPVNRTVEPLVLKEFKNRWYLFAKDTYDKQIKCYALDRLSELTIGYTRFVADEHFNFNERLKYCFGIMSPNAERPSEVILSFEPFQGKYIKSLPLHDTQEIIKDTEDELRIRLTVYLTYDFLQELLSHGDRVKVIKPKRLANELKKTYARALEKY
jgi:predicted DNA-binding transcriptional regulator YafY